MTVKQPPEVMFSRLASVLTRAGYPDFFDSLVKALSSILGVEYVLIADVAEGSQQAYTLAVSGHGKTVPNFSYNLRGSPCETVPEREVCSYENNVAAQFPEDTLLTELNIHSYAGMPILTSDGRKLGLLSAMAEGPFCLDDIGKEILRIAAAQVGAVLETSRSQQRIRSLTYEDVVTGLPNRQHLHDWLTDTADIRCLLLIDIQRFKEINDLYSHSIGDAVLYAVAERLQARAGDRGYLARLSSDEFALIPRKQWSAEVAAIADDIQLWFQQPIVCGKHEFHLDVTIGAASRADIALSGMKSAGNELLRSASVALAEAKAKGSTFEVFNRTMVDSLKLRQSRLEKLLRALRNDQLELHYQPQLNLETRELVGAEVLCRWNDDELGWVSPTEFIPLAEERGLICELGNWVIRRACQQLMDWERQGAGFSGKLSVNISSKQLDDPEFVQNMLKQIGDVHPSRLVLELTESAMMRSPEVNLEKMKALGAHGFVWAIDDFGTGYSSLAYLTRIDASILKIDRTFTSRVPGSKHDESVIRTIIAMSNIMNMRLVAEGIETDVQSAYLVSAGCLYGQGFHFGKPVNGVEFAALWLQSEACVLVS
jgi:diguanylate cyclase (GGDEF)-like protein